MAVALALGATASVAQAGQYGPMVGEWAWEGLTIEVAEGGDKGVSARWWTAPRTSAGR